MKLNTVALTLATAGLVAAQPHNHAHRHHAKRAPGAGTVIEYELNGQKISAEDVCKGIADGTLQWASGQAPPEACQSSSSSTPTPTPTPSPTAAPAGFAQTPASSSSESSSEAPSSSASSSSSGSSSASSSSAGSSGVESDFPDGELDCDTFPSQYGAVPLDYLGLGGWSGIQYVSFVDELISDIVTAVTGDSCHGGAMCSYACPAGYQKSQWPSTQGKTGQSVGGLQCKNGKLYLTNPSMSKKLCTQGVGGVNVQNNIGEQVAVCRTDYPGTEAETVPLSLGHNDLQPLTCPDANKYFHWQGKPTSAQYYVNPKGVPISEGCKWGDGSKPVGNWAPLNMGIGENNGKWLSLFQNSPTTNEKLDYNVKITGKDLSGSCKYEGGSFISEAGTNDSGCTVSSFIPFPIPLFYVLLY